MAIIDSAVVSGRHYDVVVVGTGFGSTFFVHGLLQKRRPRILMIEWGSHRDHAWQVQADKHSDIACEDTFVTGDPKVWNYTVGLGGGMNCWYAQTPRFHPKDFKLKTHYGIGEDWPLSYDQIERYYCDAEYIMNISGDPDMAGIMPRSRPFPLPPHRLSTPDELMKRDPANLHFAMPTARASVHGAGRSKCCASMRCYICPVDAKFTGNNGFSDLYFGDAVDVVLDSEVVRLDADNSSVSAAIVRSGDKEYRVSGDLFVLGANAIQSPAILLRSSMDAPLTGLGLHESVGRNVEVFLDGVDAFDGSTITTGLNYSLYDGPHRAEYGAALVYFDNRWSYGLRPEQGRWRQTLPLMIVTEATLDDANRVTADPVTGKAVVHYPDHPVYGMDGHVAAFEKLGDLLAPLPVEAIHDRGYRPTESHLQGTLRMGHDPSKSVIDGGMVHHRWRNLVCVGSSAFASSSCANPSLTVAALSLRAADGLF